MAKNIGLKEYPLHRNVLYAVFSKLNCRTDGKKPAIVFPAKEFES